MKVLHVISTPAAGGAEVYVKDLAKSLSENGVQVYIGFLDHACDVGRDTEFENYFLKELESLGVVYFFIGRAARKNPLLGALRVKRFVKKNQIDLYHSHLRYGVLFGCLLRLPRVYTHHNTILEESKVWAYISNFCVDAYVGISKVCSSELEKYIGRGVYTIYNGIDSLRLNPHIFQRHLDDGFINCISIGRIQAQKNYALLVDAVSLLPEPLRDRCTFNIVGEGPQVEVKLLAEYIVAKELSAHIKLLGNRNDVPELLGRAHLFIMSSAWEGLPIALIEASQSGLPCIVTDVGGCSEIIKTCKNGLLVRPNAPREMADAIIALLSDSAQFSALSKNSLERSKSFTIRASMEGHMRLYKKLLCGNI